MKKFHFPLERVREWREKQVTLEEAKLEILHAELHQIDARRAALAFELEHSARAVAAATETDALTLRALDAFQRVTHHRQEALDQARAECDARTREQRQRVMEAQRRMRLLDKLKQRKLQQWHSAFNHELEEQGAEAYRAKWGRS